MNRAQFNQLVDQDMALRKRILDYVSQNDPRFMPLTPYEQSHDFEVAMAGRNRAIIINNFLTNNPDELNAPYLNPTTTLAPQRPNNANRNSPSVLEKIANTTLSPFTKRALVGTAAGIAICVLKDKAHSRIAYDIMNLAGPITSYVCGGLAAISTLNDYYKSNRR